MSAADYEAACKERAFDSLSTRGTIRFHRSFTMDHIIRAESSRVIVKVPIAELQCVAYQIDGSVLFNINQYGTNVALGAWDLGFDDEVPPTRVTSRHWRHQTVPYPHEVLRISGEAAMKNGAPQLKYLVTVKRAKVNVIVVVGYLTLGIVTPPIPAPVATLPPPPLKRPSTAAASSPPPSPKRLALAPPPPPPPPQPSTSRIASQLAKATISGPSSSIPPTSAAPPQSSAPSNQPSTSAGPPHAPLVVSMDINKKRRRTIFANGNLVNYGPMKQKYMLINSRANKPEEALNLKKMLKDLGVVPKDVEHVLTFAGCPTNFNFLFNVESGDEEKLKEKLFEENEWPRVFCAENFGKGKPFFSKSMKIGVLFQTVLVATRKHRPVMQPIDRELYIWSEMEIKRALRNEKVERSMKAILNKKGNRLWDLYKEELL